MNIHHAPMRRKTTELPWAPEIPAHWEVRRAKFLFDLQKRPVRPEDDIVTAFRDGKVTLRANRRTDGFTNALKEIGYQGVRRGDLVIHAMDAFAGAVGVSDSDGKCTPVYSCCTPRDGISADFYARMVRSMAVSGFIESLSKGIRERSTDFRWREFAEQALPVPPLNEQTAIARFLDRETARIDALIEKKERFIALLRDKLNADIIRSVEPRSSWRSYPFWRVATAKSISGMPDVGLLSVYLDRGVIPYSEGGGLVHKPAESLDKYQLVEPGDLVMNNQQAWRGSLGVSLHRGIVSPAYLVFALDRNLLDPTFANFMFRSRPYVDKFMLASMSVGDIQRQIKWPHLRVSKVFLPSLLEQRQIVARLEREGERLTNLIARTERSIALLKEKRAALITAAVTGKIDVRAAA
ncbi:restriction endonuclease subunit S [Salinarimonas sp.]|uniref:restriction endonuclease subunit S n=1 Tax=Salinarimonas sp. TaxID=2766526 RepID=UPI00391D58F4